MYVKAVSLFSRFLWYVFYVEELLRSTSTQTYMGQSFPKQSGQVASREDSIAATLFRILISTAFAVLFIFLTGHVRADTANVVISEIMWDGEEYIELYNAGEDEILLDGWELVRQKTEEEAEKTLIEFGPEHGISPGEYFLIERSESASEASHDALSSSLVLVNSGEKVVLYDDEGVEVDVANSFGSWFAGENTSEGISMERSDYSVSGDNSSAWHTSVGEVAGRFGTPGAENSVPAVNEKPEAVISVVGDEFLVGEEIEFSGDDSSDPDENELTFSWDFGDASSSDESVAVHSYDAVGTYEVVLVVSDGEFEDETTTQVEVVAQAYSNDIFINELLPNPVGSDTAGEFIELINNGDEVSLSGWKLDDAAGGSSAYEISDTVIESGEILSFPRSVTGIALNNGGDSVRLIAPDGEIKDEFSYDGSISEGSSYARDESDDFVMTTTVTEGKKNIITQASQEEEEDEEEEESSEYEYSDAIVVNELLPNPVGSDNDGEFIELYNTGGEAVSLFGWELDDAAGGSGAYDIPDVEIGGHSYMVFDRSDTGIALNNTSDSVRLFDPDGSEVSSVSYDESFSEGVSYARHEDGSYDITGTVTRGEENVFTSVEGAVGGEGEVAGTSTKSVPLSDVRGEEEGTMITTEGIVSALPGVLGKGVSYLSGSGIQLYFSKDEYPDLKVGDRIRVTGELSSIGGEARLKLASASQIVVVDTAEPPDPHPVKTGEVDESMEGSLVVISGPVSSTSGDTFYVNDGSGEAKVFIKESTGIDKPRMRKGMVVTITGIVSETSSGYRILPRVQEDVQVGAVTGLTSFPKAGAVSDFASNIEVIFPLLLWAAVCLFRPFNGALEIV